MVDRKFINRIHIENDIVPVYQRIQSDTVPVFTWGIGALANNIPAYCRKYDIKLEGYFVDIDKHVDSFQGLPVYELNELVEKYPIFSVIIGHCNYEDGIKKLKGIKNVSNIYCVVSLCYGIYNLIAEEFIEKEINTLNSLAADLKDDFSRDCLCSYFEARINDKAEYIFPYYSKEDTYWSNDTFELTCNELLLDVGSCVGKELLSFVDSVQGNYKGIIAIEPDDKSFRKLQTNIKEHRVDKVIFRQECISDHNGYDYFRGEKEHGGICIGEEKGKRCPAITIDNLCKELDVEREVSIIKIIFPNSVPEILLGGRSILQKTKPKLIITVGFDERVLLDTYKVIKSINSQYDIYLRYALGLPQGLTLFAI